MQTAFRLIASTARAEIERAPSVISIYQRSAFGVLRYYVADSAQADLVATLTGQASLSFAQVKALQALGFTVAGVPDPREPDSLSARLFSLGASAVNVPPAPVNPIQVVP